MPTHFNSFINNQHDNSNIFSSLLDKSMNNPDEVFVTSDKKKMLSSSFLIDTVTKEKIGKDVITLINNENNIEIVDLDITLLNNNPTELEFLEKLNESSEANEYYEVTVPNEDIHFQIETVNRYLLEEANIEKTQQKVSLSCFPFQLSVYDSIEDFNKQIDFGKPIKIGDTNQVVNGVSNKFMAVGNAFNPTIEEPCSFIVGKIITIKEINTVLGDIKVSFLTLIIDTAVGIMPVAVSSKQFDLTNLAIGKHVAMFADVKADFKI